MKEIEITEKDIFFYVNKKQSLDKKKRDYIEENESRFSSLIDIISDTKSPKVDEEEEAALELRIRSKFPDLQQNIYILYPIPAVESNVSEPLTMAAASPKAQKSVEVKVFADKESKYLVKLIKNRSKILMCIFSEKNKIDKNLKIIIHPSSQKYMIADISKPIEVDPILFIKEIIVEEL